VQEENTAPEGDQPSEVTEASAAPAVPEQPADPLGNFSLDQVPADADRDWLGKRHQEMTGSFTRKTQELADERRQVAGIVQAIKDPNHPDHNAIIGELGFEVEGDNSDVYGQEEYDTTDAKIERLEQQLASRDEREQEQQLDRAESQWLRNSRKDLEAGGSNLSDEEWNLVEGFAVSHRFDDGEPDVAGGIKHLTAAWDAKQKNYELSKKAPRGPGSGMPATKDRNTSTRADRIALGQQVAESMTQAN